MAWRDDLRYSRRALLRTPRFTLALVASGAIGIGVNAVVFGLLGHLIDPAAAGNAANEEWVARAGTIRLLLGAVASFVFVISAASVLGLLLSRASSRVHETSVRITLGAHGRAAVRPLLAEGILVAMASIALGLLMAFWTVQGLPAAFYAEDIEAMTLRIHWPGVAAAALAGCAVVIAGAMAPLLWISRQRPAPDSRGTGEGLSNTLGGWRSTLVVVQLTLCAALLISTGAVVNHLEAALRTTHAERTGNAIVALVEPEGGRFIAADMLRTLDTMRTNLGDRSFTLIQKLPGGDPGASSFKIDPVPAHWIGVPVLTTTFKPAILMDGRIRQAAGRLFGGRDTDASCKAVVASEAFATTALAGDPVGRIVISQEGTPAEVVGTVRHFDEQGRVTVGPKQLWTYGPQKLRQEGYSEVEQWKVPASPEPHRVELLRANVIDGAQLELLGLSLVDGRTFDRRDSSASCMVALLNREAAAQLGQAGAIGTAVIDWQGRRAEIVGIVEEATFRTLQPVAEPTIYFSYRQRVPTSAHFIVAVGDDRPESVSQAVTTALTGVDGGELKRVVTLQEHLHQTAAPADRIVTTVVQVFAVLALVLSLIGVTGITTDAVARRTAEIALRLALGAPRWRIVSGVVGYGMRLAGIGTAAGIALCVVTFRFVAPLPDGSRGPHLWIWLLAPLLLLGLVVVSTLLPARRAVAVDPSRLLRQ